MIMITRIKNVYKYELTILFSILMMIGYYLIHEYVEQNAPWLFWVFFGISVAFTGFPGFMIYFEKYFLLGNFQEALQFPQEIFTFILNMGEQFIKAVLFLIWDMVFQNIVIISKIIFYIIIITMLIDRLKKFRGLAASMILIYILEKYFPTIGEIQHICWNHVVYLVSAFFISMVLVIVFKLGKDEGLKESDQIFQTFEKRRSHHKPIGDQQEINQQFNLKEKKQKYKEEDFNCKICLTEKAVCFGQNCLHLVSCEECVENLQDKCPVCRKETEFIQLYV